MNVNINNNNNKEVTNLTDRNSPRMKLRNDLFSGMAVLKGLDNNCVLFFFFLSFCFQLLALLPLCWLSS